MPQCLDQVKLENIFQNICTSLLQYLNKQKKQIRLSGARVLTSEQCIKIMKEKENAKKEKELEIQRRKDVRERKKREKGTKEKKTTQNTQKGKGKGKGKAAVENINNENWETCPICNNHLTLLNIQWGIGYSVTVSNGFMRTVYFMILQTLTFALYVHACDNCSYIMYIHVHTHVLAIANLHVHLYKVNTLYYYTLK